MYTAEEGIVFPISATSNPFLNCNCISLAHQQTWLGPTHLWTADLSTADVSKISNAQCPSFPSRPHQS